MKHVEHIAPIIKLNLKFQLLNSSLCDYNDGFILAKGIITIPNTGTVANPTNAK